MSSGEPSGNFGSPAKRGCANSPVDGLVEVAMPPVMPPRRVADTPSGRNISAVARSFGSSGALDAYACIWAAAGAIDEAVAGAEEPPFTWRAAFCWAVFADAPLLVAPDADA